MIGVGCAVGGVLEIGATVGDGVGVAATAGESASSRHPEKLAPTIRIAHTDVLSLIDYYSYFCRRIDFSSAV